MHGLQATSHSQVRNEPFGCTENIEHALIRMARSEKSDLRSAKLWPRLAQTIRLSKPHARPDSLSLPSGAPQTRAGISHADYLLSRRTCPYATRLFAHYANGPCYRHSSFRIHRPATRRQRVFRVQLLSGTRRWEPKGNCPGPIAPRRGNTLMGAASAGHDFGNGLSPSAGELECAHGCSCAEHDARADPDRSVHARHGLHAYMPDATSHARAVRVDTVRALRRGPA